VCKACFEGAVKDCEEILLLSMEEREERRETEEIYIDFSSTVGIPFTRGRSIHRVYSRGSISSFLKAATYWQVTDKFFRNSNQQEQIMKHGNSSTARRQYLKHEPVS